MSETKWADSNWRFLRVVHFDSGPAAEFDAPYHQVTGGSILVNEEALRQRIADPEAHDAAVPEERIALAAIATLDKGDQS